MDVYEKSAEKFSQEDGKEIGRVTRPNSSDIVVRIGKYKGDKFVDIRHYLKNVKIGGSEYTGFSKKGIWLVEKDLNEIIRLLTKAKEELEKLT